ncbi:MAG: DUF2281 domain-containing protein [Anaerolineales bacterium]|nr:DUF2281 domain-containing protein [Anaerolineales bacterium]
MNLQQTIEHQLDTLPLDAQTELLEFISYLQFKYTHTKKETAVLKGLWADVHLDVSQEDIRLLRQQVGNNLLDRYPTNELSS